MDVLYFLVERTRFIRAFYDSAVVPFSETMRLIQEEEPPFVPPYSEDGEPAYLSEWIQAATSVDVLGQACVSMLSDSLKLYFLTWERELGLTCPKSHSSAFKRGFTAGYRSCFEAAIGVPWTDAPADLDLLEQITLARNDVQHPKELTTLSIRHRGALQKEGRNLFFITDFERKALVEGERTLSWLMGPTVAVNREALFKSIEEVEKFTSWLEDRLLDAMYPHRVQSRE